MLAMTSVQSLPNPHPPRLRVHVRHGDGGGDIARV
jgi:hypothetical protein